jgi:hypothetical protein
MSYENMLQFAISLRFMALFFVNILLCILTMYVCVNWFNHLNISVHVVVVLDGELLSTRAIPLRPERRKKHYPD